MRLRCYCCGQALGLRFALVTSATTETDRVFTMLPQHSNNVQDAQVQMVLREEKPARMSGGRRGKRIVRKS